jgi:hypothetical protein
MMKETPMAQSTLTFPAAGVPTASRTVWRVAGALILAHIALLFSGFAFQVAVDPDASPAQVARQYSAADMPLATVGVYVEAMSFLVFAVAAALIFRLFAQKSSVGRLASTAFVVIAGAYVAATLAVGFAPAVAALHGAHLGADANSIAMVNDIRNVGFVLQTAMYAAATIALGVAAIAERTYAWWGWVAAILGGLAVVVTPIDPNLPNQVVMLWWVVLAVLCLRAPRGTASSRTDSAGKA